MTEKNKQILDKHFGVHFSDDIIELEKWTDGGVDMIITINKNKPVKEQLQFYVDNFDVDEEIEIHRLNKEYRENFKIRESLEDFESFIIDIKQIVEELE